MSLTNQQISALYKLYPQTINTIDDVAYDVDNNEVAYDISLINAQIAQDETNKNSQVTAKASALAKLTAIGLTADEIKALIGQ